jgi:PAS domain S-box-containing protein
VNGAYRAIPKSTGIGGVLVGVMEFFGRGGVTPDAARYEPEASARAHVGRLVKRKEAQNAIRQSEALKTAIVNSSIDGLITVDHAGRIVEFNPAAEHIFGYGREETIGRDISDLIPPAVTDDGQEHRDGFARRLDTPQSRNLGNRTEMTAIRSDGTRFPVELTVTRVEFDGPPLFAGFIRDISERRRAEDEIEFLAYHDKLTGLPNRAMFEELVDLSIARARRNDSAVAVL